jgi:hypothetical protein
MEEEWILWILHRRMGNKWSIISKYIDGRTDNTIKNHWNSTMKKKCKELNYEFENIVKMRNEDVVLIENDILEKCKNELNETNKKFFDERMKYYKKFINSKSDSKSFKSVLNLRTHSKKTKKRGRKRIKRDTTSDLITPDIDYPELKRINFSNSQIVIATPEKYKENVNITNIASKHIQPCIPFKSTYDKTRSEKKNCFMCRIKPLIVISELVDIEDPNMLDKIDNKVNIKKCACESPIIDYCNNCTSNKKDTIFKQDNSYASKNFYNMDYTPNRYLPTFSTPAYLRHSYNFNSSDSKMNNTKYNNINTVYIKYSFQIYY